MVYQKTLGEAPNRKWVLQWDHFSDGSSPGASDLTYQAIIEEVTGKITYQYASLSGLNSNGLSATVGIEGSQGLQGMSYLINGEPADHLLSNGLAVSFTPKKELVLDISVAKDAPLGKREILITQRTRVGSGFENATVRQANVLEIVPSPTEVIITSPITGDSLEYNTVMVEGFVPTTQDEIGVVVNGVIAHVIGDWFVANNVPLVPGENTITAIATDFDGNTSSDSVVVSTIGGEKQIELLAKPESGIGPLEVEFSSFTSLGGVVTRFTLDTNNDGIPEFDLPEIPDTLSHIYTQPGLFFATATVEDDLGNVFWDVLAVNVLSVELTNALLMNRWGGFRTDLSNLNIDGSMNYLMGSIQPKFKTLFEDFGANLPAVAANLPDLQLIRIVDDVASFFVIKNENGVEKGYFIYFVRDENGLWKIQAM